MPVLDAQGESVGTGELRITTIRGGNPDVQQKIANWKRDQFWRYGRKELPLRGVIKYLPRLQKLIPGLNIAYSHLYSKIFRQDGTVEDYGLIGVHLVTNAGKNAIAGAFNNVAPELELFKFHAFGTGATAAAVGDTALQTEATTAYNPDNTRPTGSQANSTNTYTTIATFTPDGAITVTEWGLLTQAATGGGTLFDRQVFGGQILNGTGDAQQMTYIYTQG